MSHHGGDGDNSQEPPIPPGAPPGPPGLPHRSPLLYRGVFGGKLVGSIN